jgi:hypothetical protein
MTTMKLMKKRLEVEGREGGREGGYEVMAMMMMMMMMKKEEEEEAMVDDGHDAVEAD